MNKKELKILGFVIRLVLFMGVNVLIVINNEPLQGWTIISICLAWHILLGFLKKSADSAFDIFADETNKQ